MRLHFVLPQMLPYYGMEKAASLLMRALASDGCEVSATVLSGSLPSETADINVESLDIDRGRLRLVRAVPELRRRLAKLPRDAAVIASGLWGSAPVAAALLGTGRSYVAWEHSVLMPRLRIDKRLSLLFRFIDIPDLRPRRVIAVSDGVRRTVSTRWPDIPTAVIPNIVEAPQRPPPPRQMASLSDEVKLLTTGAFRPNKNYLCAVEAMQHLSDRFTLRMAGDGEQFKLLQTVAERTGVIERVQFLGRVPSVDPLLANSHLLIHPSLFETFGFSLVEAADAGVPVVALSVPTIDEMVPRYVPGILASGMTSEALAEAIDTAACCEWTDEEQAASWHYRREAFSASSVAKTWRYVLQPEGIGLGGLESDSEGTTSG